MVFPPRRRRQPDQLHPLTHQRRALRSPSPPVQIAEPIPPVPPIQQSFVVLPRPVVTPEVPALQFNKRRASNDARVEESREEPRLSQDWVEMDGPREGVPRGQEVATSGSGSTSTGPGKRARFLSLPWKKERARSGAKSSAPPSNRPESFSLFRQPPPFQPSPPPLPSRLESFGPPLSPPPTNSLPPVPTVIVSSPTQSTVSTSTKPSTSMSFSPAINIVEPAVTPTPTSSREGISGSDEEELNELISRWRSCTPEVEVEMTDPPAGMSIDIFSVMVDGPSEDEEGFEEVETPTAETAELPWSKRDSSRYSGLAYSQESIVASNLANTPGNFNSFTSSPRGARLPSIHFDSISMDSMFAEVEEKLSLSSYRSLPTTHEEDDGASSSVTTYTTISATSSRSHSTAPTSAYGSMSNKSPSIASRSTSSSSNSTSSSRSLNSHPLGRPLPRRTSSRPSALDIAAAAASNPSPPAQIAQEPVRGQPRQQVVQPRVKKSAPPPPKNTQIRISTRTGAGARRTAAPIRRAYGAPPVPPTTPTSPSYLDPWATNFAATDGRVSPALSTSSTVVPNRDAMDRLSDDLQAFRSDE